MRATTDNLFFRDKVELRKKFLPESKTIHVLDCFYGSGRLWNTIQSETEDKKILVTGIDKKRLPGILCGDNRKFLQVLNLSEYEVIDLDAYGNTFDQIEILLKRKYSGVVFFTWCKRGPGPYPVAVGMTGYHIRSGDIDLAADRLSNYFHKRSISFFDVIRVETVGGFNFYDHFVM
ncbi:MAG: hypothetical protein A2Z25_14585 [Planctomycetes bacterium RBG_16_55_9]|nr:MAG: hypothetical protein A2Z25_14585 [Planctomycetes bacterium RBG_16_55_9]